MSKERLDQKILRIDPRVKDGYYSDMYFNRTKEILEKANHHPVLRMQIFQRNDDACLCGVDEAIGILRESLGSDFKKLTVKALRDGDIINAWETVMTIDGDYSLYPHLETVYLGALARGTKVATNVYQCVREASGKPVLFFPARFDSYLVQAKDGYSYTVGSEVAGSIKGGVSTAAQGEWWGGMGLGTVPHSLIAAFRGNTVQAALQFCEHTDPKIRRIILVDFHNDCVKTSLAVAKAMLYRYLLSSGDPRYKLFGVRLDTSGTLIDKSVAENMSNGEYSGVLKPTGVTPQLVWNVHNAFQEKANSYSPRTIGRKFYKDIGIVVSGGFTVAKIKQFEALKVPVSAYGIGSSLFSGNFDFTADIVQRLDSKEQWGHNAKVGRKYNENPRLQEVK